MKTYQAKDVGVSDDDTSKATECLGAQSHSAEVHRADQPFEDAVKAVLERVCAPDSERRECSILRSLGGGDIEDAGCRAPDLIANLAGKLDDLREVLAHLELVLTILHGQALDN